MFFFFYINNYTLLYIIIFFVHYLFFNWRTYNIKNKEYLMLFDKKSHKNLLKYLCGNENISFITLKFKQYIRKLFFFFENFQISYRYKEIMVNFI